MATNYQRGADFERRCAKELEGKGFAVVRSAGSHKPADLVAMLGGIVVCVQCKSDGRLGPEEWNDFWDWCERAGAVPVMAEKGPRGAGVIWRELTGRKGGRGRQPMKEWEA